MNSHERRLTSPSRTYQRCSRLVAVVSAGAHCVSGREAETLARRANEESASDRCSAFACDGQPDAGAPDPVLCELVGDVAEDGQPGLVVDSPVAAGADDD